jgi:protein-tyrosine phosphatase
MLRKLISFGLFASCLLVASAHAEEPRKIAFVDTGNTGRSVSAEALANALIKQRGLKIAVISRAVDLDPFDVHPEANAEKLLHERGLEVGNHVAASLSPNDIQHADVILTMSAKHRDKVLVLYPYAKDKVFTLSEYATGSYTEVADAWGKPMEVYVAMIKQLDGLVPGALDKSIAPAPKK